MQEKRFRNQVSWMMFLFSILVIWVHSYNAELFAGGQWGPAWDFVAKIQQFVSVGIGQIAVPGFFMLSSYLFFRNFTWARLPGKWKGRFFSVVIPYVTWNLLYYLGYVTATRVPAVWRIVGKEPVPFTIEELTRAILHYSYAPVFWYLYQLIFLILLSPVVYILVKNKAAGIVWLGALLAAIHFHIDTGHPNTDALFYYSFAAYIAIHGKKWAEAPGTASRLAAVLPVLAAAMFCYHAMGREGADVLWTIFYRLSVPVSLWLAMSCVPVPDTKPWMRQSLFLYAAHFIVVRFVNKGTAMILARFASQEIRLLASLVTYFILPAIVVALSYLAAHLLMRWLPFAWRILSGGRSLQG